MSKPMIKTATDATVAQTASPTTVPPANAPRVQLGDSMKPWHNATSVRLGDSMTPWAKAPRTRLGDSMMPW
ncbi:MAG: hypothetical protein AB7F78_22850 [Hyphomicrobiaceae bacterium]